MKAPRWKTGEKEEWMMKRKVFAALLAAALTAMLLTACGGSAGGSSGSTSTAPSAADGEGPSADADYGGYGRDENGYSYGFNSNAGYELSEPLDPESPAPQEDAASRLPNAKMIYTANLEVETTGFDACTAGLETLVEQVGGYMEYASASSYGTGYRNASYTVRVPAPQFKAFLNSVGEIGHVVYQDKSSDNISEAYYDTESRLVTQKTKLERLQALLAQAENMEDIITIESAISETEYEIEQLTGTLRHYDALVDFSTVYISLREVARLSTVETAPPSFSDQLGTAFTSGLTGFGDFLQSLAITIAYSWIWLLILIVIIVAAVRRVRKSRNNFTFPHPNAKKTDDKTPKE